MESRMSSIRRLKRRIIRLFAPKHKTRREIFYLKRAIRKNEEIVERIYDAAGIVCCHHCAFPELYDIEEKLDRQYKRLKYLNRRVNNGK